MVENKSGIEAMNNTVVFIDDLIEIFKVGYNYFDDDNVGSIQMAYNEKLKGNWEIMFFSIQESDEYKVKKWNKDLVDISNNNKVVVLLDAFWEEHEDKLEEILESLNENQEKIDVLVYSSVGTKEIDVTISKLKKLGYNKTIYQAILDRTSPRRLYKTLDWIFSQELFKI